MKRIRTIAILAALTACALTFAACSVPADGGRDTDPSVTVSDTDTETEPGSVSETVPETEPETEPAVDPSADKQAFYEKYFDTDPELAGKGMRVVTTDGSAVLTYTISEGIFAMSSGENEFEMYQEGKEAYLHVVARDGETGELQDQWYRAETEEDEVDALAEDYNDTGADFSNVVSVRYLETATVGDKTYDLVSVVTSKPAEEQTEGGAETVETEVTVYVTADTHVVEKITGESEVESVDENGETVMRSAATECTFFDPEAFRLPEGVEPEELSSLEFSMTFMFAMFAVAMGM